eukprot:403345842
MSQSHKIDIGGLLHSDQDDSLQLSLQKTKNNIQRYTQQNIFQSENKLSSFKFMSNQNNDQVSEAETDQISQGVDPSSLLNKPQKEKQNTILEISSSGKTSDLNDNDLNYNDDDEEDQEDEDQEIEKLLIQQQDDQKIPDELRNDKLNDQELEENQKQNKDSSTSKNPLEVYQDDYDQYNEFKKSQPQSQISSKDNLNKDNPIKFNNLIINGNLTQDNQQAQPFNQQYNNKQFQSNQVNQQANQEQDIFPSSQSTLLQRNVSQNNQNQPMNNSNFPNNQSRQNYNTSMQYQNNQQSNFSNQHQQQQQNGPNQNFMQQNSNTFAPANNSFNPTQQNQGNTFQPYNRNYSNNYYQGQNNGNSNQYTPFNNNNPYKPNNAQYQNQNTANGGTFKPYNNYQQQQQFNKQQQLEKSIQQQMILGMLEKNSELGRNHMELSKGVMECFKLMNTMIGPLIQSKDRENRRLKRYINDRLNIDSDRFLINDDVVSKNRLQDRGSSNIEEKIREPSNFKKRVKVDLQGDEGLNLIQQNKLISNNQSNMNDTCPNQGDLQDSDIIREVNIQKDLNNVQNDLKKTEKFTQNNKVTGKSQSQRDSPDIMNEKQSQNELQLEEPSFFRNKKQMKVNQDLMKKGQEILNKFSDFDQDQGFEAELQLLIGDNNSQSHSNIQNNQQNQRIAGKNKNEISQNSPEQVQNSNNNLNTNNQKASNQKGGGDEISKFWSRK